MVRFPRVQRVGRLEDRAVALERLDLAGERRDDPVADLVARTRKAPSSLRSKASAQMIRAVRVSASSIVTAMRPRWRRTQPLAT
jgi:hypothetical protein